MNLHDSNSEHYYAVGDNYVERDVLNIAQKIADYDENLRIQYLESAAKVGDPPFRIVERCKDGRERIVMFAWQLDDRIMQRLLACDTYATDVLTDIDSANAKAKMRNDFRFRENRAAAHELVVAIAKSPKDSYSVKDSEGKKVTFTTTGTGVKHESTIITHGSS